MRAGLVLLVLAAIAGGIWYATRTDRSEPPPVDATDEGLSADEPDEEPALLEGAAQDVPTPADKPTATNDVGEGDILYFGHVVNAEDEPVVGAEVVAKYRGEVVRTVSTDKEGKYRFRASFSDVADEAYVAGIVIARAKDDLVGYGMFTIQSSTSTGKPLPNEREIRTIMVRPGTALRVSVTSNCNSAPPATVWVVPAMFGQAEAIALDQVDASGDLTLEGIPPGKWRVVAAAEGCGRDNKMVDLPQADNHTLELTIPESRSLTILVRDKDTEKPIANARVSLQEHLRMGPRSMSRGPLVSIPNAHKTNDQGTALIEGLGDQETLQVNVSADGYPGAQGRLGRSAQGRAHVKPDQSEITIELQGPRTIRWPMEDKGAGIPDNGSAVTVKPFVNSGLTNIPTSGTIENGEIVVDGWGPGFAAALAYVDGYGAARIQAKADEDTGSPAAFYPLRKIELFAKNADGTPAVGVFLIARGPGNNVLLPPAETNAEGYAILRDLFGGRGARATCAVSKIEQSYGGSGLGSVDLSTQDGRFEFTMPSERTLRVAFLVDGAPVPNGFRATARLGPQGIALKPKDGTCEVTFTPVSSQKSFPLYLILQGYSIDAAPTVDLALADPIPVTVHLSRTGHARIQVIPPADGRQSTGYEIWNNETKAWANANPMAQFRMASGRGGAPAPDGFVDFRNLKPGRYRAIDNLSHKVSAPFDVVAGDDPVMATLDLSKTGWVKGKVIAPPGVPVREFSVGPESETKSGLLPQFGMYGQSGGLPGTPIRSADGSFEFRVDGETPITLRTFHVTCRPHATKGRVTVTGPRDGVELHAEYGPKATVKIDTAIAVRMNRGRARPLRVRLYKDKVEGDGIPLTGTLNAAHDTIEFGGYSPGTYHVWIDMLYAAPLIIHNVKLTEDDVDLGTHTPSSGSSLIVHMKVAEGQSPPRIHLNVQALEDPKYQRNTGGAGARVVLSGIGKGTFRAMGGAGKGRIDETFTFDGKSDIEHTIDLR